MLSTSRWQLTHTRSSTVGNWDYEIWGRGFKLSTGTVQADSEDEALEEVGIAAAENGLTNSIHEIIVEERLAQPEN